MSPVSLALLKRFQLSGYLLPVALALALHGVVITLLLAQWGNHEPPTVAAVEHYYIDAALVKENPFKAKQEKARQQQAAANQRRTELARQASQQELARRDAARREELRQKAKAAQAQQQADLSRLEKLRAQQAAAATAAAASAAAASAAAAAASARAGMETSLARAIRAEQNDRKAVTDDEKAMAYVSQIQREIIQNWSRPPSARNGMQALLKVYLVPTGEVVNVTLTQGSGNDAFDRSAVLAVRKAERFVVPAESAQFERNFREFEVLFRPDDLRL
ncbi:MAG: cell envelope integrity protein TolA [Pseudomonadales bacterium]|nr:cell envelope integrity protein TolA [Pseudomonadales bacterium]MDP5059831.1 cell envelope integrity protein TolA [Pseudomonadales bacterium]